MKGWVLVVAMLLSACGQNRVQEEQGTAVTESAAPPPAAADERQDQVPEQRTQIVAQWSDAAGIDALFLVEDTLIEFSDGSYEVDGHDIGSGTFNVFMDADDANVDVAVALIVELASNGELPPGMKLAVAQYTNAERTDWTFKPIYPAGLSKFDLM